MKGSRPGVTGLASLPRLRYTDANLKRTSGVFYRKKGTMRASKNTPQKPNGVPVGSSSPRKGNSTLKRKKKPVAPRFYEVKIRLPAEDFARGKPYFGELKHLGKFMFDAYREKVNRAESNDKAGKLRILANNIELLLPVIMEMHKQGKLDFLLKARTDD
jgi:hypothetical protein